MQALYLLSAPGGTELIIILVVVLLLFGGKKIPELMKGLGRGVKEFDDARNDKNRDEDKKEESNK